MKAEITFDLVMKEDMAFIEGCYRLDAGVWQVFMFRKSRGVEKTGITKDIVWKSGIRGMNVIVSDDTKLEKSVVFQTLSDALGVTEWLEVQGPDSMQLR
jgi:hypothetical protein